MTQQPDISSPLRVDVVSDVVCPWCFVGKRRLEAALQELPGVHAEIFWRPFQLDGTIPKGGILREEYLTRKFGANRAKDMYGRLEGIGKEVGIPFAFDAIKISPNTLDAHRLLRWAQSVGTQSAVKERLFQLFFIEGKDIGDPDVLAQVAAENGIETDVAKRLFAGDTEEAAVKEEIDTAARMGITGVPFFIFNSKVAVSGAQTPDVLIRAAELALTQAAEAG